jgi:hypothetical protein
MTAQSQSASVVASATNFVWTQYYPTIVITNTSASTVTTNAEIFVRTDGIQAVAGAPGVPAPGNQAIPANTIAVLTNQLPLPQAEGTNVLGLLNDPLHATQVSVIGGSAGPMEVTVSPQ